MSMKDAAEAQQMRHVHDLTADINNDEQRIFEMQKGVEQLRQQYQQSINDFRAA